MISQVKDSLRGDHWMTIPPELGHPFIPKMGIDKVRLNRNSTAIRRGCSKVRGRGNEVCPEAFKWVRLKVFEDPPSS